MNLAWENLVTGLLSLFFVFASSIKLFGWQKTIFETQLAFFKKYGLNRAVMALVGLAEFAGAVLLWLPGISRPIGAAIILATSLSAIYFHLRFDTWKDGIPALVTGTLSAAILLQSRHLLPI